MIESSVKDTGIGIKQKDQKKLFKLFGFLDSTKELNPKGIGLGLNISKKIAQQFGGDIKVSSQWKKGSTFSFVFALEKKQHKETLTLRVQNPLQKTYMKIKIKDIKRINQQKL